MTEEDRAVLCGQCQETFPDPGGAALVEGRYRVESALGSGQQGMIFAAHDLALGRRVALKMLHPAHAGTLEAAARLKREALALASVHCDHVAQVYSFGAHADTFFLAMEYVRGRDLDALVAEHRAHQERIPTHRGLTIVRQIAQGLASLHAAGVVHRDVKPSNVMIEEGTGRTVLLDLGLARWFSNTSSPHASIVGTPAYMAPEQIAGTDAAQIAGHTDVYALGCTAFELFTGLPPFPCSNVPETLAHQMWDEAPRLSTQRPDLAFLDPVLHRALAKDPNRRYQTCTEMIAALDAVAPRVPEPWDLAATPATPRRDALRLMVVDDDEVFCAFAATACQLALPGVPLELVCAASGVEALQVAARSCPDVVVLDFDMPLLDGLETLSYLRAMPGGFGAQVMLVSPQARQLPRWRFTAMGVTDFLTKPVDLREFTVVLGEVAGRAIERRLGR